MDMIRFDIALLIIIGIVIFAKILNQKFKIPLVHSLIVLSYVSHYFGWLKLFDRENIVETLFLLIPLILLNDVLHLKFSDVQKYKKEIFLLAFVGVNIAVFITTFATYGLGILGVGVGIGAYLVISVIITATDAISVGNIFSQFKSVSTEDKILVEGDSLGNDGTTIVLFYFIALPWMLSGNFDFTQIPLITIKVFGISTFIGFVIGYLGYLVLKQFNDRYTEFLITIATIYLAFVLAEYIHVAGVFALIVAGMTMNTLVIKDINKSKKEAFENIDENKKQKLFSNFRFFKKIAATEEGHKDMVNLVGDFGFIAVTILFVALSELISPTLFQTYWKEILIFFAISTIARGLVIALFNGVSGIFKTVNTKFNGWVILTLSGIKGGISIIMVYSIPTNYPLVKMFEAITMGLIILSIFSYGITLLIYMVHKEKLLTKAN